MNLFYELLLWLPDYFTLSRDIVRAFIDLASRLISDEISRKRDRDGITRGGCCVKVVDKDFFLILYFLIFFLPFFYGKNLTHSLFDENISIFLFFFSFNEFTYPHQIFINV